AACGDVITPMRRGKRDGARLRAASNRPSASSLTFNRTNCSNSAPAPTRCIASTTNCNSPRGSYTERRPRSSTCWPSAGANSHRRGDMVVTPLSQSCKSLIHQDFPVPQVSAIQRGPRKSAPSRVAKHGCPQCCPQLQWIVRRTRCAAPSSRARRRWLHADSGPIIARHSSCEDPRLLSIIQAAGWPIWPLIVCSIVALALVIERLSSLRESRVAPPKLLDEVISVTRANLPAADVVNKLAESSVLGRVLAAGLRGVIADPRVT